MTKPQTINIDHLLEDISHVYESDDYIFVSLAGPEDELQRVASSYKDENDWELTYHLSGSDETYKVHFHGEQIHHGSPLVEDGSKQGVFHWTFLASHTIHEEDGDE